MSKPVSVIIPVYNSERFLRPAVESALNQSYSNIEIICIDDGSTDNSLKILNEYRERIKIFTQKNQGLASSINNAISKCKGDWIKWLSPDDVMYPNCIEDLIKCSNNNSIIYSNWDIIDENSTFLRTFYSSQSTASGSSYLITNTASSGYSTISGELISLVGTNNAGGENTTTGIEFADVTAATNNMFNAIEFGTG